MTRAAAMVTKDAPVLEPDNAMFDTGSPTAMSPPGTVAHDAVAPKHGCNELGDPAVAAVCKHSTVGPAEHFDRGAAVVHRIVAVAGSTGARPTIDRSRLRTRICALQDQR